MTRLLRLELPEEVYQPLAEEAERTGQSLEQWVVARLRSYVPTPEERQAAFERLMRHAGAADLGHATGANNDAIDADLAREYGSTHEE
jgi:hypothetical protein